MWCWWALLSLCVLLFILLASRSLYTDFEEMAAVHRRLAAFGLEQPRAAALRATQCLGVAADIVRARTAQQGAAQLRALRLGSAAGLLQAW